MAHKNVVYRTVIIKITNPTLYSMITNLFIQHFNIGELNITVNSLIGTRIK